MQEQHGKIKGSTEQRAENDEQLLRHCVDEAAQD